MKRSIKPEYVIECEKSVESKDFLTFRRSYALHRVMSSKFDLWITAAPRNEFCCQCRITTDLTQCFAINLRY